MARLGWPAGIGRTEKVGKIGRLAGIGRIGRIGRIERLEGLERLYLQNSRLGGLEACRLARL